MRLKNSLIFVLGKNKELSIAEILSWFESHDAAFRIKDIGKYFLHLQLDHEAPPIEQLGGTIKMVKPLFECSEKELHGFMESMPLERLFSRMEKENVLFGVSLYGTKNTEPHMQARLAMIIKEKLKEEGKTARFMPSRPNEPWLTHVEIIKKDLIEKSADICVCIAGEKAYIGRTEEVHNPFGFQKRDVGRPSQRTGLAMPPRLAKILVNLSEARKTLLDPFCGIGTILQEALLNGLEVVGTDIDPSAISMCRENMKWLSHEYNISPEKAERVFQHDAGKISAAVSEHSMDGIATEPPFGPLLKHKPTYREARTIVTNLEGTYFKSLRAMRKALKPEGKIAMTFPRFRVRKGVRMEAEKIAERTGFAVYDILEKYRVPHIYPVLDFEPRHMIMREVHVFRKA